PELRVARRRQRQVAERAAAVPALVALLRDDSFRPSPGLEIAKRLQPLDPRVSVPALPAPLRVVEVLEERPRVGVAETEPAQPLERLVRPQASIRPRAGSPAPREPRDCARTPRAPSRPAAPRSGGCSRASARATGVSARASGDDGELLHDPDALLAPGRRHALGELQDRARGRRVAIGG